jgi:glycosyltransferase involved in cell wall biosynthesis
MAGPGIRYSELARVLSRHFRLTLAVPSAAAEGPASTPRRGKGETKDRFVVQPYQRSLWASLASLATQADVIVACGDTLADFPQIADLGIPLVIDGYDPHLLETLALWAHETFSVQDTRYRERLAILQQQCQAGDFFICASERQRDWWLGLLEQQGRVNPHTYADNPSLRRLIDVVPYGLPPEPPQALRPILRSAWPGIGPKDRIVLWGGGLWQWLDPLTAIQAVGRLAEKGTPVRLVFPGTRHPNPKVPDMPMRAQAIALADELELTGQHVFFGEWVPYEDWPAVLLEADVGLSLHPDTVEARLAFRSRVLDYIWAALPMVVTRGDAISEVAEKNGLGVVVDYGDANGVAQAIQTVLEQPRAVWRDRFSKAQKAMTWECAAQPLVTFCQYPYRAADRASSVDAPVQDTLAMLDQTIAEQSAEIARLQKLVAGYEQGRFMKAMRQAQQWRKKAGL